MKLSKYNYFIEIEDQVAGINLLTKNIFCLTKEKYDYLNEYVLNNDKYADNNSSLISAMYKLGIIVDDSINELQIINARHRQQIFSDLTYRLTINPTLDCNLKCWYCYETHIKNSKMSEDIMSRIYKMVVNKILNREINGLNLDWFGGEPLIYFNEVIYPLSKKLDKIAKNHSIHFSNTITTNGVLIGDVLISRFIEIGLNNFQITIDGDESYHNKIRKLKGGGDTYMKIINNINLLCKEIPDVTILLRFNYTKNNIEGFKDIIPHIEIENRNKIEICFQQVWQEKNIKRIIDVSYYKRVFFDMGFKEERELLNFKGYTCYADKKNQSVINFDGNVFKCTARNFSNSKPDGYLNENGIIEWDESLFYKRFGNANYENEMCANCLFVPVCFGPCSQKKIESENEFNNEKYCLREGVKLELNNLLKNYHNHIKSKISNENIPSH